MTESWLNICIYDAILLSNLTRVSQKIRIKKGFISNCCFAIDAMRQCYNTTMLQWKQLSIGISAAILLTSLKRASQNKAWRKDYVTGGKSRCKIKIVTAGLPWLEWRNATLQWCIVISVMHCYSLLCSFLHCQYGSLSGVTQCYSFTLRLCILAIVLHCCNLQCSSEKLHSALAFHWNRDLFVSLEVPQSAVTLCLAQILSIQPWDTFSKILSIV